MYKFKNTEENVYRVTSDPYAVFQVGVESHAECLSKCVVEIEIPCTIKEFWCHIIAWTYISMARAVRYN